MTTDSKWCKSGCHGSVSNADVEETTRWPSIGVLRQTACTPKEHFSLLTTEHMHRTATQKPFTSVLDHTVDKALPAMFKNLDDCAGTARTEKVLGLGVDAKGDEKR